MRSAELSFTRSTNTVRVSSSRAVPGRACAPISPSGSPIRKSPRPMYQTWVSHQGRSLREPGGRVFVDLGLHAIDYKCHPHAATSISSRSATRMPSRMRSSRLVGTGRRQPNLAAPVEVRAPLAESGHRRAAHGRARACRRVGIDAAAFGEISEDSLDPAQIDDVLRRASAVHDAARQRPRGPGRKAKIVGEVFEDLDEIRVGQHHRCSHHPAARTRMRRGSSPTDVLGQDRQAFLRLLVRREPDCQELQGLRIAVAIGRHVSPDSCWINGSTRSSRKRRSQE